MKKLVITAPHKVEITQSGTGEPGEDQVKIKIKRVSLCGSDMALFNGSYRGPCRYPLVFGHEWSGVVMQVGRNVKDVLPGDFVTGDCSKYCGKCDKCSKDKNLCSDIEKFGITIDGYAAEEVVTDRKYIYVSKTGISHKLLALTEVFSVALHALKRAGIEKLNKDAEVLITGCGAVGMAALFLLKRKYKFENIIVAEKSEEKLKKVMERAFGVYSDVTICDNCGLSFARVAEVTDVHFDSPDSAGSVQCTKQVNEYEGVYSGIYGAGGFDFVFEASGTSAGLETAVKLTNPGGRVSFMGMSGEPLNNPGLITLKALTLTGSIGGTGEFEEVLVFFEGNEDITDIMITDEVSFEQAGEEFEHVLNDPSVIKCQIVFSDI